eukprot:COSAG02_NODE_1691_length_11296_cov_7.891757_13_plen_128_part_00
MFPCHSHVAIAMFDIVGGWTGSSSADCVITGLSNSGRRSGLDRPASWLLGQFSLTETPRWGPPAGARLSVPPGYQIALVLQNQDENRNVWSTLSWASWVNTTAVLELDSQHGTLKSLCRFGMKVRLA